MVAEHFLRHRRHQGDGVRHRQTHQVAVGGAVHGSGAGDDDADEKVAEDADDEDDALEEGAHHGIVEGVVLLVGTLPLRNVLVAVGGGIVSQRAIVIVPKAIAGSRKIVGHVSRRFVCQFLWKRESVLRLGMTDKLS